MTCDTENTFLVLSFLVVWVRHGSTTTFGTGSGEVIEGGGQSNRAREPNVIRSANDRKQAKVGRSLRPCSARGERLLESLWVMLTQLPLGPRYCFLRQLPEASLIANSQPCDKYMYRQLEVSQSSPSEFAPTSTQLAIKCLKLETKSHRTCLFLVL